jgi:hypothetical protein
MRITFKGFARNLSGFASNLLSEMTLESCFYLQWLHNSMVDSFNRHKRKRSGVSQSQIRVCQGINASRKKQSHDHQHDVIRCTTGPKRYMIGDSVGVVCRFQVPATRSGQKWSTDGQPIHSLVWIADHSEVCRKCAVRCDPVCAKAIPFNTKPECFRAGFGLRK